MTPSDRRTSSKVANCKKQTKDAKRTKPNVLLLSQATILIGQTPKSIQMEHFKEMSIFWGLSPETFANMVIGSDRSQLLKMLRDFYVAKDPKLAPVFQQLKCEEVGQHKPCLLPKSQHLTDQAKDVHSPIQLHNMIQRKDNFRKDATYTSHSGPSGTPTLVTKTSHRLGNEKADTENDNQILQMCAESSLCVENHFSKASESTNKDQKESSTLTTAQLSAFESLDQILFGENS